MTKTEKIWLVKLMFEVVGLLITVLGTGQQIMAWRHNFIEVRKEFIDEVELEAE